MIEKGRYQNIPQEEWLCDACNETEDEIHFLDKCIKYNQIRSQLLNTITNPSDLFLFINMQDILVKYVFECSS